MTRQVTSTIEVSSPGVITVAKLNELIASAWRDMLADPATRREIEAMLGTSELSPDTPPVEASKGNSGSLAGDVVIHLADIFTTIVVTRAAEPALDTMISRVRELWKRKLRSKVNPPTAENLGKEKKDVD